MKLFCRNVIMSIEIMIIHEKEPPKIHTQAPTMVRRHFVARVMPQELGHYPT
jgi:hypothetical protein